LKENLIEFYLKAGSSTVWRTTTQGNALSKAKFIKQIDEIKAASILSAFLERADEVNKNDQYLFKVEYVGLFGSFAKREKDKFSDIDLIVLLKSKSGSFNHYLKILSEHNKTIKYLKTEIRT
jgi:predicted nucleotidyltransferase